MLEATLNSQGRWLRQEALRLALGVLPSCFPVHLRGLAGFHSVPLRRLAFA